MKKNSLIAALWFLSGWYHSVCAQQDTVDINLNVKHIVGGVSEFDRSKFIIIHDDLTGNEWDSQEQQRSFLKDYDVYFGRNNGGIVWEWNNTREDPANAGWPDPAHLQTRADNAIANYAGNTFVHQFEARYDNMMIGGQEFMFPHGQATNQGGLVYGGFEETAEFYAQYLSRFFGSGSATGQPRPRMLEVINEPFVKANQLGTTNAELSRYHNVVAQRVKELNPNILVGGYTAAYPQFEAADFNHWRGNWKLFIDIAGENMDFFSFHIYDVLSQPGDISRETQRKGSNMEAIMDMINHYSYLKLGEVRPWSISEYGWFCPGCDGGYDQKEDWYQLRSYNAMMLQLMERQDQILNAIPFMILKALWAHPPGAEYNTYGPRLLREIGELPGEPAHAGWMYTDLLMYFRFWAGVKGTRIDTKANDIDILSDAYVEGKNLYLILCNLNHEPREVNLKFFDPDSNPVSGITVNHLYGVDDVAKMDTTEYTGAISKVTIDDQATMILRYTFENDIVINEENTEASYFADKYFQEISAGQSETFTFTGVQKGGFGEAVLRLGLGRDHGKSLKPSLTVNGSRINVPEDWRGYDQKNRDRFFGVIEIPVPYHLLQASNEVMITFNDNGGHITSMVLQVFNFTKDLERSVPADGGSIVLAVEGLNDRPQLFPNPAREVLQVENNQSGSARYFVVSLVGVVSKNGFLRSGMNNIDIGSLPAGVYFLVIEEGQNLRTKKFIKNQ